MQLCTIQLFMPTAYAFKSGVCTYGCCWFEWIPITLPPPIVGCTPHVRLDRAVPLGIGEAASSKRLSGQRPTDRSGLAKDRSKQTASVSVCKGRVKWMFDLLSLAPDAFRAASSVSELWWDVSGFGQNPPDVQLWPKYEAVSARLWRLAAHVEWFWCSIECISACLLFQRCWFRKYFFPIIFLIGIKKKKKKSQPAPRWITTLQKYLKIEQKDKDVQFCT